MFTNSNWFVCPWAFGCPNPPPPPLLGVVLHSLCNESLHLCTKGKTNWFVSVLVSFQNVRWFVACLHSGLIKHCVELRVAFWFFISTPKWLISKKWFSCGILNQSRWQKFKFFLKEISWLGAHIEYCFSDLLPKHIQVNLGKGWSKKNPMQSLSHVWGGIVQGTKPTPRQSP